MSRLCRSSFAVIVCHPASQTVGRWHTPSDMHFFNLLDSKQATRVDLKNMASGLTVLNSRRGQRPPSAHDNVGTIPAAQAGGTEREIDGAECPQLRPWEDSLCSLSW